MEQAQAPQTAAPAPAPAQAGPTATPAPAAAPAYVPPANYVPPGQPPPPGAATDAYGYLAEQHGPTGVSVAAGGGLPGVAQIDATGGAGLTPQGPAAGASAVATATPGGSTVIQGRGTLDANSGARADLSARTGNAQNGAMVQVDSTGRAVASAQANDGQGSAGQITGATDGENWRLDASGGVPAGANGTLTASGGASGGPGQAPSGYGRLDLGLPQLDASAYANEIGTPAANGGGEFNMRVPVGNNVDIMGGGGAKVGPGGAQGHLQAGVEVRPADNVRINATGNMTADQQNGIQGGGGATLTITE